MKQQPTRSVPRGLAAIVFACLLAIAPVSGRADLNPDGLRQIDQRIQSVTRAALPCTVALIPGGPAKEYGTGSGVVVSPDGLILTAAHVTMGMGDKVIVIFPDGKRAKGKVLGMDYTRDSGMVQITDPGTYPHVPVGDSTGLQPDDWCLALGHSGGFDPQRTPPVRLGRVIQHDPAGFLMTDSTLIGGDSGGPLFDLDGRVIGIHSNIGFSLSQNNHVPIAAFHQHWDRLKAGERFGGDTPDSLLRHPDLPPPDREKKGKAKGKGRGKGDEKGKPDAPSGKKSPDPDTAPDPSDDADAKKPAPADRPPVDPATKQKQLDAFERKLRESIESGEFQMTPADVDIFESPEDFKAFMDRFKKSLKPSERRALNDLVRPPTAPPAIRPGAYDPDQPLDVGDPLIRAVLDALRPSVSTASQATHLVFRGDQWRSLCTVVHPDGFAVTKASEIELRPGTAPGDAEPLTVMLSKDRQVPAEVLQTFPKHDLALIRLQGVERLPAVSWASTGSESDGAPALPLGGLIGAAGSGPDAVAIGVVSVQPRSLAGESGGFLAIGTASHEDGVLVTMVMPGGAAAKAGIKKGDVILSVDGTPCDEPETLISKVKGTDPGKTINVEYRREQTVVTVKVTLGDRSSLDTMVGDPNAKMNRMGTDVSERRTGYERALQTDLPIRPQECGGPVVDLAGRVLGLTIARAGRTATYALLADDVRRLVDPEIAKRRAAEPPRPALPEPSGAPAKPNRPPLGLPGLVQ